eukprot:TRINITY_DN2371_c0_g1_i1.p1 TRINITY_DN2371_c0_g1~~TRINITY_DN2371_c0_g1_i1.p1  ORF type:complete len:813 (-),score=186.08 TRINITY_DN2371_c0_g1_i1:304-2742(-)
MCIRDRYQRRVRGLRVATMPWYRCNVCNVTSRDQIQHDRHLEGARHRKNVATALGDGAGAPAAKKHKSGHKETKREMKQRLEQEHVAAAAAMLNPLPADQAPFRLQVMHWTPQHIRSAPGPIPALPGQFSSAAHYASMWKMHVLEEAREAVKAELAETEDPRGQRQPYYRGQHHDEGGRDSNTVELELQSFGCGENLGYFVEMYQPASLVFGSPSSGSCAEMEAGTVMLLKLQSGQSLVGYVTHKTGTSVTVETLIALEYLEARSRWKCTLLGSCINHERMYSALSKDLGQVPAVLHPFLLGQEIRSLVGAPCSSNLEHLNQEQQRAVRASIQREPGILEIQGPPGTGKTHTVLSMIATAALDQCRRVLVTAPSNQAIHEQCTRWIKNHPEVPCILISHNAAMETAPTEIQHVWVQQWATEHASKIMGQAELLRHNPTLEELQKLDALMSAVRDRCPNTLWRQACANPWGNAQASVDAAIQNQYTGEWLSAVCNSSAELAGDAGRTMVMLCNSMNQMATAVQVELVQSAMVVFCTLTTCGRPQFAQTNPSGQVLKADLLIVDEAAQSVEPEILIAMCACSAPVVALVGDPNQLPATVLSQQCALQGFNRSMMDRLMALGPSIMLREQHRMHPALSEFPSLQFYDGQLINMANEVEWTERRHVWYELTRSSETKRRHSIMNRDEAAVVASLAKRALKAGARSVAAITFYSAQVLAIQDAIQDAAVRNVRVGTVDGFQGAESDVVILSFVRTGDKVGFLKDFRRLNVALTRAKTALWMVGSVKTMSADPESDLGALIKHMQARRLVRTWEVKSR